MQTRPAQAAVFVLGRDGMAVYLWHLPLYIALNGIALVLAVPFPEPGSVSWWATRPIALVVVLAAAIGVARALRRWDRPLPRLSGGTDRPGWPVVAAAAVCTIGPAFVVMQWHLSFGVAVLGAVAVPIGVWLAGRTRPAGVARAAGRTAHS